MTTHKTVAKNRTKLLDAIFARATGCKVYRLDDNFQGQPVDAKWARQALAARHARLTDCGNGRYNVYCHSNCWYEFTSTVQA
jgi:hypothetical protein